MFALVESELQTDTLCCHEAPPLAYIVCRARPRSSMAYLDTAIKGQFNPIHWPLTERCQAVPAEDQTLPLSYFYFCDIDCKSCLESLSTTCPTLFCFPSVKRVSALLEVHVFLAAILQQFLQIENMWSWLTKNIWYIGENWVANQEIQSWVLEYWKSSLQFLEG